MKKQFKVIVNPFTKTVTVCDEDKDTQTVVRVENMHDSWQEFTLDCDPYDLHILDDEDGISVSIYDVVEGETNVQEWYDVKLTVIRMGKANLDEKTLTNREVLEMLSHLSLKLDGSGFSRVLDVVEGLTGDRNFEV